MLSKEELKQHNIDFWTDFKKFMSDFKSSNGKKINWISYPTGIKQIYLRFHADKHMAALHLDFQYKDASVRAVFWEQMYELKKVLSDAMNDEGIWFENIVSEQGFIFNRIEWKIEQVNYLKEEDKNKIFSFLKDKVISFDGFYQDFKEILLFLAK